MCAIFSNGMLLQRDIPVKIWGKASPNAVVEVQFANQKKSTTAEKNGKWSVSLDKMPADKNPRDLIVLENGKEGKKISDVLVGEVWVLGGQSNMGFLIKNSTDFKAAKARADYPLMRWFFTPGDVVAEKEQFDCPKSSHWEPVSPKNLGNTRAVDFYFAEKLMKDLGGNIPVGLIDTPLGGSAMRAWIPDSAVKGIPFLEKTRENFAKAKVSYDYKKAHAEWKKRYDAWKEKSAVAKAAGKPEPRKPNNVRFIPNSVSPMRSQTSDGYLFNAKIAPIAGFAARGVLWYQGESDSSGEALAAFKPQFVRMVETWRKYWGQGDDLYFAWVQLAGFDNKNDWPQTRWQQYLSLKEISHSGMANIVDCGEEKDIHPRDKTTVGMRLENIAMRDVYGAKNSPCYGPIFKSASFTPDGAMLSFYIEKGCKLVGKGSPRGFELKIDGEWKQADARILGTRIKLVSMEGIGSSKVEGVRYLWSNWTRPQAWLFDSNGLPALSFVHEK